MTKFLIIRFSSIGDIIQCMDVVNGICNRFPDAEIHWIARKDMASFLHMDRRVRRVWEFDRQSGLRGLLRMARRLRAERFDYIYDAHSNIRSAILKTVLLPSLGGGPRHARRSKERWKRFLLFKLRVNRFDKPFRGVVSYRKPLARWGITDFTRHYADWQFPADYARRFADTTGGPRTVTLVPSANWPMKRWPVAHWRELVRLLPDCRFVILAGPADTFCETICEAAPERVENLAGRTSLLESCYLVKRSRLVVSADTGFLHAADLFGTPAIALMGPTAFGFPTGESARVMETDLPCRPCTKDGRGQCRRATWQQCMTDILPQRVAEAVRTILNDKN